MLDDDEIDFKKGHLSASASIASPAGDDTTMHGDNDAQYDDTASPVTLVAVPVAPPRGRRQVAHPAFCHFQFRVPVCGSIYFSGQTFRCDDPLALLAAFGANDDVERARVTTSDGSAIVHDDLLDLFDDIELAPRPAPELRRDAARRALRAAELAAKTYAGTRDGQVGPGHPGYFARLQAEDLEDEVAADVVDPDADVLTDKESDDDSEDDDYTEPKSKKPKVAVAAPAAAVDAPVAPAAAPRQYVVIDDSDSEDDMAYEIAAPPPITDAQRAWVRAQRAKNAAANAGNGSGTSSV